MIQPLFQLGEDKDGKWLMDALIPLLKHFDDGWEEEAGEAELR